MDHLSTLRLFIDAQILQLGLMQKRAEAFFLLLMSVFLLGISIHLVIPLQIIVNGTQRVEEVYNGYKIQVEQNTVRAIAYLNSLAISNQIQMYQNVRSAVIRLFDAGDRYEDIDVSKVLIYNAYQFANSNSTDEHRHSMWFITGISSISQMSEYELWMYMMYAQIEKYLDSIQIHNKFHEGLKSIQITINFEGQHVYFEYPTSAKEQFKNLNYSIFTDEYYNTILNFKTQQRYQTTFHKNNLMKTCSPILDNNQPFAVVCLSLDVQTVTRKITSALKVPNFELSSSRYYLVRPIYQYEGLNYPQIISYFNSDDLNNVYVPQKQYFQQDILNSKQLFSSHENFLLNVQQLQKTKTYYVTPIQTYNNIDTKQIIMYLIVVNDFAKSQLKNASHYKQIFVVMIVPSTILLIIAALAMGFLMRPLFRKLHQYSSLMNQYCNFIRKNDLTLEISEVGQTIDFIQIFRKIKYLNLINKMTTPAYLKVSQNQRIIKLLRGLELFDELAYNKTNIYQNLAKCYYQIGQLQNALKFLKLSVERSLFEFGGIAGIQAMIKEQGDAKLQKRQLNTQKSKQRPSIRHFRYKIYRLCSILYEIHKEGQKFILEELIKNVDILKRLHYRSNISIEYVYCFLIEAICSFDNYVLYEQKETEKKIILAREMIKKLENSTSNSNKIIPIQILKSYLYYLKGKWLRRKEENFEAYENFILALNGQHFDPAIHLKIKEQIIQIMKKLQLDTRLVQKKFKYLKKTSNRGKQTKQFIFLTDVSNPRMNIQQFNQWKSKARKMAEYIMDKFIKDKDRIGISQFCTDLKVVCNLVQKNISETMLKKQLMSSIKARDQTIYSHLIPNLKRAIERTKNLKNQKIFLIFLKEGYEVDSSQILQEIKNESNSIFIFLVEEMSDRIRNKQSEGFFIIEFQRYDDLNIILGEKNLVKADNIIYLF